MQSDPAPAVQIAPDPNLAAEQQQAQTTLIAGLQQQAKMDTADIMTRFGTMRALSRSAPAAAA